MRRVDATRYAAVGAGLIAISWGLARYAFGLFVPPIRAELGLSQDVVGVVGALAFISFALASGFAPTLADRLGARNAAMVSGGCAVVGLALISQAVNAIMLGTGVFACGISTGLMFPALSAGVHAAVRRGLQGRVTAVMNAGTSLGLIASVPAVLVLGGAWRGAYVAFAAIALIGLVVTWRLVPSVSRIDTHPAQPPAPLTGEQWRALSALSGFAFAAGVVAAPYWIFAPDLVVEAGSLPAHLTAALWLAVGAVGLAGAWASDLSDRIGVGASHALTLGAVGAALAVIAAAPGELPVALASAALFGWAFMSLTGIYIVTGVRLLPNRPALGPVVPALAATIGQAVGSPLVGWIIVQLGHVTTFAAFAVLAVLIAACSPLYPADRLERRPQAAGAGNAASP